jgi:hypothetical protein
LDEATTRKPKRRSSASFVNETGFHFDLLTSPPKRSEIIVKADFNEKLATAGRILQKNLNCLSIVSRVTGGVSEKIAQNVAKHKTECITFFRGKVAQRFGLFLYVIPKVKNDPVGENSPNQVTLIVSNEHKNSQNFNVITIPSSLILLCMI